MKIGKKSLEWSKCETSGKEPSPRVMHSMNYYEEGNFLIIHGGNSQNGSDERPILNDTFVFELSKFEWIEVKISMAEMTTIEARCGHSSVVYSNRNLIKDNKLIIFGGLNDTNYIGSSLFIINLDSSSGSVQLASKFFNKLVTEGKNFNQKKLKNESRSESKKIFLPKLNK